MALLIYPLRGASLVQILMQRCSAYIFLYIPKLCGCKRCPLFETRLLQQVGNAMLHNNFRKVRRFYS